MSNYFYFRILPEGLLCDTERDLLSVAKFLHLWWIFCLTIGRVEFDAQIPATNSSRSTQTWRSSSSYLQWIWSSDSAADDVITRDYQWPRVDLWLRRDLCLSGDHVYCSHCLPKPTGKLTRHKFLCLGRQGRLAGGDLDLSVCPSVCSSVTKFVKRYFENEWTHFGTNGPRGTHARNDQLWRLEVKRQGHTRPKINLEAWRSSFSTLLNEVDFLFYCKTNVVRILPWLRRSRRRQR